MKVEEHWCGGVMEVEQKGSSCIPQTDVLLNLCCLLLLRCVVLLDHVE